MRSNYFLSLLLFFVGLTLKVSVAAEENISEIDRNLQQYLEKLTNEVDQMSVEQENISAEVTAIQAASLNFNKSFMENSETALNILNELLEWKAKMPQKIEIVCKSSNDNQNMEDMLKTLEEQIKQIFKKALTTAQQEKQEKSVELPTAVQKENLENTINPKVQFESHAELTESRNVSDCDLLRFHKRSAKNVKVTNDGRTVEKPNEKEYGYAAVLTHRQLRPNELFEVLLERFLPEWHSSIRIGVTIQSAEELIFPDEILQEKTGTWIMVFNRVYYDSKLLKHPYGQDLQDLKAGDRVGVMRTDDGSLHFYVNGVDQGVAATSVPAGVYGVLDLFVNAAQASIVDQEICDSA